MHWHVDIIIVNITSQSPLPLLNTGTENKQYSDNDLMHGRYYFVYHVFILGEGTYHDFYH